ncbi:zinc-dependent metalloprotease [Paremcibacter congregatus]|uniref:zinc-dependent metalloprotease n=1 Tax=Paremcibacter congregatus TaxID=2043170 RepID=UPI003A90C4D3
MINTKIISYLSTGRFIPAALTVLFLSTAIGVMPTAAEEPAQEEKAKDSETCDENCEEKNTKKKKVKIKSIKEFAEKKERKDGLFVFYIDPENGEVFMEITTDQLEQNFIYFSYTKNGTSYRAFPGLGDIRENSIISIRRNFNRVDFFQKNTQYTFDPDNALAAKPNNNVAFPLLASAKVVAQNEDKSTFVINAGILFKSNAFVQLSRKGDKKPSKTKSSVLSVRNYPGNTEILSEYVFDKSDASNAATSSLIITLQHNFLTMPEPGFIPRRDDPRVGYFSQRKTNLTRVDGLPYDDLIQRWRLIKSAPEAAMSPPVKPITFWIENTTPHEYRTAIAEGVLAWNAVFEKAGFKNAITVEVQPDDAEWDAGDIRYNVLRWIASPLPRFLGYGPRYTNPLTGEILGADIVLEQANITRAIRYRNIYGAGDRDKLNQIDIEETSHDHGYQDFCALAQGLPTETSFAQLAQATTGPGGDRDQDEIIRQSLYYVVLHEVGHTLGLTHNMMGSYYRPPHELNGKGAKQKQLLVNSVMDYPAVNIAPKGEEQGLYFPDRPGPYDQWAITFGYDDRMDIAAQRAAHLAKSASPELRFGNDADAMVNQELGIDPRANVFDLSSDPIAYSIQQIEIANDAMRTLHIDAAKVGKSWDSVRRAFRVLLAVRERSAKTISRYIAGVYVDRAFVGQATTSEGPFVPVEYEVRKRAMNALSDHLFAPDAYAFPEGLLKTLQEQRRGFDFYGFPRQDPLVHAWIRSTQEEVIAHLLNHRVLRRLTDSGLYGNTYSVGEMITDLTNSIFEEDIKGTVNSFRRNLQIAYVLRIVKTFKSGTLDAVSESELLATINKIDQSMKSNRRAGDQGTRAHRAYIRYLIEKGLDE